MSCTYPSQEERCQIRCLWKGGWSLRGISVEPRRSVSTISRELRRNQTADGGYDSRHAQHPAIRRRHATNVRPRIDELT